MKGMLAAAMVFFAASGLFAPAMRAQTPDGGNMPQPNNDEWHQIYLEKPAKSLEGVRYNKTDQPVEGELSKDRMKVYLKNYERGSGSVKVNLTYQDGEVGELSRSSCFIDPVPPL